MDIFSQLLTPGDQSSRVYGMVVGVVTNNKDPDALGRVKVKFPWLSDTDESHWARVVTPMAGGGRGFYFLPEVDDEVLVGFEHGDVRLPYVLGSLWNGKDKPPEKNDDGKNNLCAIKSRSGHLIRLDDTDGQEKIEIMSANNKITISTKDNSITIEADKDITLKSKNGKLVLEGQGVEIKSTSTVKVEATSNMDLKSSAQLNIKGAMVNIN